MHATICRIGTKERVGMVSLEGGVLKVDVALEGRTALVIFLSASHVTRVRTETGQLDPREIPAGSAEHLALRLEALPAIGFFATDVTS